MSMKLLYLLLSVTIISQAQASTIEMVNNDTAKVEVIIEPGEGSLMSSTPQIRQYLNPGEKKKLNITQEIMGQASTISITGKVTMPSLNNQCKSLFLDKNYKIVFTGSKTGGVVCQSELLESNNTQDEKRKEA